MARAAKKPASPPLPRLVPVTVLLSASIEDVLWDAAQYMATWPRQLHLAKFANCHDQMAALNREYRAESSRVHAIAKSRQPGAPVVLWGEDACERRRDMLAAMVGVLGEHLPRHRAPDTLVLLRDIRDRAMRAKNALERAVKKSSPAATTSTG